MQEKKLNFIFRKFKLLRVLELDGVRVVSLPSTIGDLIQLRYLGLRKTNLEEELPPSIGNLQNLQTLDLRYCCFLKKIPNVIWKLVNLRHLLLYTPFDSPDSGHLRLDTLTNLRSLPHIKAGNWIVDVGLASISSLKQLGIYELSRHMVISVLSTAQGLHNLHPLSLSLQSEEDEFPIFMQLSQCAHLQKLSLNGKIKKLPDPHEFPPNLSKLILHNSHLQKESIAKLERLPNLKMLILGKGAYNWPELTFNAEGFPKLCILRLVLLRELEEWTVEESAMTSFNNILTSMFSKWSKKSTKRRRSIRVTLNLLIIKMFWISLKRNLVALLLFLMKLVCFLDQHMKLSPKSCIRHSKNHKRFSKPKLSRSDFTICHYAGDVTYQTKLFLDKNKDYVVAEHQALLYASKCSFVSGFVSPFIQTTKVLFNRFPV